MFTRLRGRHPAGLIAIGVVITLTLSGTAMAVTDTSFTYSSVQTGYLMLGPGDLVPLNYVSANEYSLGQSGATSSDDFTPCFAAGIHLPQGASVISVRTSYSSGAGSNLYVDLYRSNPVTGEEIPLLLRTSVPDDSDVRTFVNDVIYPTLRKVNNALHAYTLSVCVGPTTIFYGARITYQYSSAGD